MTNLDYINGTQDLDEPLRRLNRVWAEMDKTAPWMNETITTRGEAALMGRQILQRFNDGDTQVSQGFVNEFLGIVGEYTPEITTYIFGDSLPNIIETYLEGGYGFQ